MDLDNRWPSWPKESYYHQSGVDEDFIMDFSDTLFTSLNPSQPFDFPNPREIGNIKDFLTLNILSVSKNCCFSCFIFLLL